MLTVAIVFVLCGKTMHFEGSVNPGDVLRNRWFLFVFCSIMLICAPRIFTQRRLPFLLVVGGSFLLFLLQYIILLVLGSYRPFWFLSSF